MRNTGNCATEGAFSELPLLSLFAEQPRHLQQSPSSYLPEHLQKFLYLRDGTEGVFRRALKAGVVVALQRPAPMNLAREKAVSGTEGR